MNPFGYLRAGTLAEAIAAARAPGAMVLAGGTNLVDLMKMRALMPATLVDVTRLPGLSGIDALADGGWRIGALVRNADLAHDPGFARACPAVAEALLSGASGQLRNAATLGGNLLQRTRCAYFADTASACNRRDPGSGCDALHGENRNHAVLGWTPACIATHPSDLAVALVALDAVVEVAGPDRTRDIPLTALHNLPGASPAVETQLVPGEIIVAVRIPAEAAAFAGHQRYIKLRERTSYAFALVSCAAALDVEGGVIRQARIALGGVAAKPWRAHAAEALLEGQPATRASFAAAADAALAASRPSGANAEKIVLARRIVVRALARAAAGVPDRLPALPGSPLAAVAGELDHG